MSRRSRGRKRKNPYVADPLTKAAKADGYAARSVFKLDEIERRFHVVQRGRRIVDLGCSPGSWVQWVMERVGPASVVVGVDIEPPKVSGFAFVHRSVMDVTSAEIVAELGGKADLVLSDMAPLTTGSRLADHVAQLELAQRAVDLAVELLRPGGNFVVKVFDGEDAPEFVNRVRVHFEKTKRVRPEAVRANSREFYLVCLGFAGAALEGVP